MTDHKLHLPAGYALLSSEEMTYTEGGGIISTLLIGTSSFLGFGVLGSSYLWGIQQARNWMQEDGNSSGNVFTVLGRALDAIKDDMDQSPSNRLRDTISSATLILLAPLSFYLIIKK